MEFKLLVLDLDGTTLKSDLTVSPRLKRLIQKLLDTFNLKITIATGRMFEKAKRYIEDICVNAPVIALNGVEIVDHSN
ncbi:MAG: HAD family hydrolase, partial [bacterium]